MDYRILRVRETLAIDLDGFIALASFVGQHGHWDSGQTLNLHHLTGMQLDATLCEL